MRLRYRAVAYCLLITLACLLLCFSYTMEDQLNTEQIQSNPISEYVDHSVHAFYYIWYGDVVHDGAYYHWSHAVLPHWNPLLVVKWPRGRRYAPEDIASNFYPKLGCYSSVDANVLKLHFTWIRRAGIGTIVVSWYPNGKADSEGVPRDSLVPTLMEMAHQHGLKVTFLIEPYDGRSVQSVRKDIEYIVDAYGAKEAFYRLSGRPMFYVYDSYLISKEDWHQLLKVENDSFSIRGSEYDSVVMALVVEQKDASNVLYSGFDGFFTYFASDGFTYGSKSANWPLLAKFAEQHSLITSFSVGPGYVDQRVRPWNEKNTKDRDNGNYYKAMWKAAVEAGGQLISITSFNEWHEGTQIEPALPYTSKEGYEYMNYDPSPAEYYLDLTKLLVEERRSVTNATQH